MKDCWLSPEGEVIYCSGKWAHGGTAWGIMEENLGLDIDIIDDLDRTHGSLTAALESLGWIRYTTLPNYATGGYDDIGWVINDKYKPTKNQIDKMFDLTGYIYR